MTHATKTFLFTALFVNFVSTVNQLQSTSVKVTFKSIGHLLHFHDIVTYISISTSNAAKFYGIAVFTKHLEIWINSTIYFKEKQKLGNYIL